jgi:hypothetical protein
MLAASSLPDGPRVAAIISLFTASELSVEHHPAKGELNASMLLGPDASADRSARQVRCIASRKAFRRSF